MKKKVCFIATMEMSIKVFMTDHMRLLQDLFDLTVVVNTDNPRFLQPFGIEAAVIPVAIERNISPANDVKALLALFRIFRSQRFDIIHSIMPKSGLLSMVAGLFARIPIRVHTFTGQVWKNSKGPKRLVLKTMDKLLASCATRILVDSRSQREFLISEGVVEHGNSSVIGNGSMCGVDAERFRFNETARKDIRRVYGIKADEIVFFFLGRMNKDKGVLDLAHAFSSLCARVEKDVHLLLAGPDEEDMESKILEICSHCGARVHIVGYADEPARYMSAADVSFVPQAPGTSSDGIPSKIYRIMACARPVIACTDEGSDIELLVKETGGGTVARSGDAQVLANVVYDAFRQRDIWVEMGRRGREAVLRDYSRSAVSALYDELLTDLAGKKAWKRIP